VKSHHHTTSIFGSNELVENELYQPKHASQELVKYKITENASIA